MSTPRHYGVRLLRRLSKSRALLGLGWVRGWGPPPAGVVRPGCRRPPFASGPLKLLQDGALHGVFTGGSRCPLWAPQLHSSVGRTPATPPRHAQSGAAGVQRPVPCQGAAQQAAVMPGRACLAPLAQPQICRNGASLRIGAASAISSASGALRLASEWALYKASGTTAPEGQRFVSAHAAILATPPTPFFFF